MSADINACLSNCTNRGTCKLVSNQTYICVCNEYFQGKLCQTNKSPCLTQSNKCLNNGKCINSWNLTSFSCECLPNAPFYGQYCENMKNLCENVTCSSHGYCTQSINETKCKCYKGYEGETWGIESISVKVVKTIQWTTTIICIVCLIIFWILIIGSDILSCLKIGNEHINLKEWRLEKIRGKKVKKANKIKFNKRNNKKNKIEFSNKYNLAKRNKSMMRTKTERSGTISENFKIIKP